jgi:hypothetical protein
MIIVCYNCHKNKHHLVSFGTTEKAELCLMTAGKHKFTVFQILIFLYHVQ